jgi:hypothetical protein
MVIPFMNPVAGRFWGHTGSEAAEFNLVLWAGKYQYMREERK